MKKEEIITKMITREYDVPIGLTSTGSGDIKYWSIKWQKQERIDPQKLASFLSKFVMKEDLIED